MSTGGHDKEIVVGGVDLNLMNLDLVANVSARLRVKNPNSFASVTAHTLHAAVSNVTSTMLIPRCKEGDEFCKIP